jgi:pimeloyl-ACP methyl ester carboxylesterase
VTASIDLSVLDAVASKSGGAQITVGVGERIHILPPHLAWGSYNVYAFSSGAFHKIISLGGPIAALPDLGAHPAVIVHGFGSSIHKGEFDALAASMLQNGLATGIIGFEYDTLDSVAHNGAFLNDAIDQFKAQGIKKWHIAAHSMGGLVSRAFLEQTAHDGIATTGNRLVTICTPNTGSPIANKLVSNLDLFQRIIRYFVLNNILDFTNADGQRCQVPLDSPGIADLENGNAYLASLNASADENHPEASYFAIGGDGLTLEFVVLDVLVGVTTQDGLVTLPSAIDIPLCYADAAVLLVSHTGAPTSPSTFATVQTFLTEATNPFCVQSIPSKN